jgi:hypothetical protein
MNTDHTQPYSDERGELVRLLPELVERDLPRDRQRHIQELVMSQIHQDLRTAEQAPRRKTSRRLVLATSALAVVALAATAVGTGGFGLGQDAGNSSTAASVPAADTFELVALNAAAKPFTPPRGDQWIYIQQRIQSPSSMAQDKGVNPDRIDVVWMQADGKKMAAVNPDTGKLDTWGQDNKYPTLSTLPTDPKALLAKLREQYKAAPVVPAAGPHGEGSKGAAAAKLRSPEELNSAVFDAIARILGENLLPPKVTAALWRAAGMVPGVSKSPKTITVDGREVAVVSRTQDGWQSTKLLVDPKTHDFVGLQAVAVKDHTYEQPMEPNEEAPMEPKVTTEQKGQVQVTVTRLAAKVVDAAGKTS